MQSAIKAGRDGITGVVVWRSARGLLAWVGVCRARRAPATLAAALLVIAGLGTALSATRALAETCPNEAIRRQEPYAERLPDCRAYEQVTPVEKGLANAWGGAELAQAAPSGAEMIYFSDVPFPGGPGGKGEVSTYLSSRSLGGEEWLTSGLLPLEAAAPQTQDRVVGVTADFAKTIITTGGEPVLAPGGVPGDQIINAYVKDNATGAYQLLASNLVPGAIKFSDATPGGSRVLFETKAKLTPEAQPGFTNLYEWNEARPLPERVRLAGVLPSGEVPQKGSAAGPGGPLTELGGGSFGEYYTQDTISTDGSRVFFSDSETGRIYVREPNATPAVTIPVSKGQAFWRAATPDGRYVLYTEGNELYRFNTETGLEEVLTNGAGGVLGTVGISDDGSYVYFVAPGELASNENGNGETAEKGAANLYEWHEGATTFIAKQVEGFDWTPKFSKGAPETSAAGGEKSSRVAPDGKAILFASKSSVTSYNSNGSAELYLYAAAEPLSMGNPVCVSCSPENRAPAGNAQLTAGLVAASTTTDHPSARSAFVPHNLSSDGALVFFETKDALVPGDINGQMDVYEWEREGAGSCTRASGAFHESNGGCLYAISVGQSDNPVYFGDASADGSNAFFFTAESLVGQDVDGLDDVYDARVGGGIASQNPSSPPTACDGETCRGASGLPPFFGAPSSTTLSGSGNLSPAGAVMTQKRKTPAQIAAERRSKALKICKHRRKAKRRRCEARVRKRYGPAHKSKTARHHEGHP